MSIEDTPELEALFEAEAAKMTEGAPDATLVATTPPAITPDLAPARLLHEQWEAVFSNKLSIAEFRQLAEDTRDFLGRLAA